MDPRRAARGTLCLGIGYGAAAGAGRLWVARSDQYTGNGHRRELDVPLAVARRSTGGRCRGARAERPAARVGPALRSVTGGMGRIAGIGGTGWMVLYSA